MDDKKKTIIGTLLLVVILTIGSIMIQKKLINKEIILVSYRVKNTVDVGEKINEDNLEEIELKNSNANSDYIKSKDEIKKMLVKEKIYSKEIINKQRLVSEDNNDFFNSKDKRRFAIDLTYFDDTFSTSMPVGSVVDIVFTEIDENRNAISNIQLEKVEIVGRIDTNGKWIGNENPMIAQSLVFESSTDEIIDITSKQYMGKFKLIKLPLNK